MKYLITVFMLLITLVSCSPILTDYECIMPVVSIENQTDFAIDVEVCGIFFTVLSGESSGYQTVCRSREIDISGKSISSSVKISESGKKLISRGEINITNEPVSIIVYFDKYTNQCAFYIENNK